jgi:hypothetical protein
VIHFSYQPCDSELWEAVVSASWSLMFVTELSICSDTIVLQLLMLTKTWFAAWINLCINRKAEALLLRMFYRKRRTTLRALHRGLIFSLLFLAICYSNSSFDTLYGKVVYRSFEIDILCSFRSKHLS